MNPRQGPQYLSNCSFMYASKYQDQIHTGRWLCNKTFCTCERINLKHGIVEGTWNLCMELGMVFQCKLSLSLFVDLQSCTVRNTKTDNV